MPAVAEVRCTFDINFDFIASTVIIIMNDLIQARPLLQEELKRLIAEENVIDAELSQYFGMIAGAKSKQLKSNLSFESLDIASSVQKLENVGPTFEAMQQDSKKMAAQVEDCRALSERLSSMVRRLDTMQIRAQQTLACTEDIMNLKECKTKILIAIEERNLAAAVSYLRQVHEIDIIAAKSSDDYEIIKEKEQIIKNMVQEEFSNAIGSSNIKSVMSLCPLLQTLGLESVARDTFLDFVEKTVFIAISADASSVEGSTDPATAYAKSLSSVFNSAYIIIQQYLPMVIQGMENSLGDVHFIRRLHKRCEQEAGMVLKRYMKFRRIREVMGAIKASNSSASTTSTSTGGSTKLLATPAEMHTIMDELALMIQYCCKYAKYIKHICKGAEQKQRGTHRHSTATSTTSPKSTDNINATTTSTSITGTDVVVVFAGATEFDKMIDELLNKYYMEGEQWLMRIGVQQALSGAIIPGGIATSEIKNENIHLDECFFLLQKCGLRAIATNNIHAACAVLHLIADLISSDLLNQANQMLNITITQLHLIMNDHINKYKRSMTNNDEESTTNDSTSSVSAGFKNALSLASTLTNNNTNNNITSGGIKLEEEGGFSLTGNPNSTITDPWGVANSIETFNILELCVRYTERLNRDISNAAMNVFASSDQENTQNTGTNASTTTTGTTTARNNKSTAVAAAAGASESDKVRLCREDFEAAKISFSNVSYISYLYI